MIESLILATLVGVVEVGPGICQMDLLNGDLTIHTSYVSCEAVIPDYEPIQ